MAESTSTKVALLGTGRMGTALAGALVESGRDVTVWNRSPARSQPLITRGATGAVDPKTAVVDADLVILSLVDVASALEVLTTASGQLRGKTVLQVATGSPEETQTLVEWTQGAGATLLVAFVKAYPDEIGTDHCRVHIAGCPEAFGLHRELMACWGQADFVGTDIRAATARNTAGILMMMTLLTSFVEGAAYATGYGVAPRDVMDVLPISSELAGRALHRAVDRWEGEGTQEAEATIDVYAGVLHSLVTSAAAGGTPTRLGEAALDLFSAASRSGLGAEDLDALLTRHPELR